MERGPRRVVVRIKKATRLLQLLLGSRQGFAYEIKLWTFKKDFYESDIRSLEAKADMHRRERLQANKWHNKLLASHPEIAQASEKLRLDIEDKQRKISELQCTTMTVEEAELRLPDLRRASKL